MNYDKPQPQEPGPSPISFDVEEGDPVPGTNEKSVVLIARTLLGSIHLYMLADGADNLAYALSATAKLARGSAIIRPVTGIDPAPIPRAARRHPERFAPFPRIQGGRTGERG